MLMIVLSGCICLFEVPWMWADCPMTSSFTFSHWWLSSTKSLSTSSASIDSWLTTNWLRWLKLNIAIHPRCSLILQSSIGCLLMNTGLLLENACSLNYLVNIYVFIRIWKINNYYDEWSRSFSKTVVRCFMQVCERLLWYERFVQFCKSVVCERKADDFLPRLCLHWDWLKVKLLELIFPNDGSVTMCDVGTWHVHAILGQFRVITNVKQAAG